MALVPGFGAGHMVAGRWPFGLLLAGTEIIGFVNLMLAHRTMGALMIAVAILIDIVGSQLTLRRPT